MSTGLTIICGILSLCLAIYATLKAVQYDYENSICKKIFALIIAIILWIASLWLFDSAPHSNHREIKATSVQVDTIVTTCREKADTTYLIHYTK